MSTPARHHLSLSLQSDMVCLWLVFIGAGLGGVARYFVAHIACKLLGLGFPYATLIVNVSGSLAMGLLFTLLSHAFKPLESELKALLLIGFLGGYTTFSSFALETLALCQHHLWLKMYINIVANVGLSFFCVWLGSFISRQ